MNKPIRYYSNSQQNLIKINYPIQQNFRPFNQNRNRFQQQDEIYYIQNDFQNYERKINQDHQQIEQNRTNFQNNKYVQDISRNFPNNNDNNNDNNNNDNNDNNNDINDNNNDNSNSQEIQRLEQNKQLSIAIDLFTVLKLLIALILITIFYYNRNLQQYIIDEDTFQPNLLNQYCVIIPLGFYTYFIILVYRFDRDTLDSFHKTAIVTYTLIFEYFILSYGIFLYTTLNQGFIYIQISLSHIILTLLVFIVRPRYNTSLRKCLSIIIVSTLSLVLFMSIVFQDKYFWWIFGIPVMIFLLLIKMLGQFYIRLNFNYEALTYTTVIAFKSTMVVLCWINSIKKKLS
ncbi:unnamed protein product [Paramecium primaurelia]|uniref:Transmembrane protein n=1 Tax=Paramecium primaurelia TaxID=5886 RepID=A0A8S1PMR8_PARPR|nr:unnamed protein product [Paramecium primaurelia]